MARTGSERTGMGVVTGVRVDSREPTLICSKFSVPATPVGRRSVLWRGTFPPRCGSSRLTSPVQLLGTDSRGRRRPRNGRHGPEGTSPRRAAGLGAQREKGSLLWNLLLSLPSQRPPSRGAQRGRAPLPRAHSSHASCPVPSEVAVLSWWVWTLLCLSLTCTSHVCEAQGGACQSTERGQGCSLRGPFLWGGDLALSPSWVWA